MALKDDAKDSKNLKDNLKEADKVLSSFQLKATKAKNDFGDINRIVKGIGKEFEDIKVQTDAVEESNRAIKNISSDIAGFDEKRLKSKKDTADLLKSEKTLEQEIKRLNNQKIAAEEKRLSYLGKEDAISKRRLALINKFLEKTNDSLERAEGIRDIFKEINEANDKLNKNTKFFDTIDKTFGKLPLVGSYFEKFSAESQKIRDNLGTGIGESLVRSFGKLVVDGAIATTAAGLVKVDGQVTSIGRNLNLSRENAKLFRNDLVDAAIESNKPVSFLLEGIDSVNESLGTQGLISVDAAKQFSTLTHRLKLSTEEASNLFNASAAIGTSFKDLNSEIVGNVKNLNAVEGSAIDYKTVMKDISGFSNATLLTQSKFEGSLTKAAFTARKLGLEMSSLENIGGNLLNFEESIAAELEAELITGKQLNLEKARMYALTGDMKFGEMNVLQQESIAKAMGMSREEMATMFAKQKALARVADELNIANIDQLSTEERIAKIMEQKNVDKSEALRMLGEEDLATQAMNVEAATAMKETAEMLATSIKGDTINKAITAPLQSMQSMMRGMSISMQLLAGAGLLYYASNFFGGGLGSMFGGKGGKMMKGGGGLGKMLFGTKVGGQFMKGGGRYAAGMTKGGLFSGVNNLVKGGGPSIKGMGTMFGMGAVTAGGSSTANAAGKTVAKNVAKSSGKSVAKGIGKSMLKKIPIVGTLAGIGFGISRAMQGDFTGAAMEVASGLASNIPGAGTALSTAIDVGIVGRDLYKGQSRGSIDQSVKEVGVVADNQNKFQAEQLKILNKIEISNQKLLAKNSDTYLNGSKLNDQIALNTNVIT